MFLENGRRYELGENETFFLNHTPFASHGRVSACSLTAIRTTCITVSSELQRSPMRHSSLLLCFPVRPNLMPKDTKQVTCIWTIGHLGLLAHNAATYAFVLGKITTSPRKAEVPSGRETSSDIFKVDQGILQSSRSDHWACNGQT